MTAEAVAKQETYLKMATDFAASENWNTADGERNGKEVLDVLCTVPGVKVHSALAWLAEIGDPTRFQNSRQVAAFVGSDPSVKVSAGKVTQHTRRKGNERLHSMLLRIAGGRMLAKGCSLGEWGRSIKGRHKKGGYRKATSAIARRIACMMWQVHMRCAAYDPSLYSFGQKPMLPNVSLEEMNLGRSERVFRQNGMTTSGQVVDSFYDGMATMKGVGVTCLESVRQWIASNQRRRGRMESVPLAPSQDGVEGSLPTKSRAKKGTA